ncbi:epithelial-stromal interaction protein 1 [Myxocyprinus asiaticus]|uniref:epithelial-stromal interaction protein 1 n=1 Tax=Myxocyprinus asiaticus TaxID=70543 RepID=UPI002223DFCA|nr:epithelial-stromal interaction protein 1 [Myxocyprinus asiaticus]
MNRSQNMLSDEGNGINQSRNMTDSEQNNQYEQNNISTATPNIQAQDQPTHADGYSRIPPNESRRSKLQRIAQKEEEDLRRWKEENRLGPIQLAPERLGGAASVAEVRQRQQEEARQSKLRKKLRKEEMERMKRQAEEEDYEKMKAKQREQANKLEMRRKQEEQQRKELYQHDQQMRTEKFFQRIERSSSTVSMAASKSTPASPWAKYHEYRESRREEENAALLKNKEDQRRKTEILEAKQKQQEEDRKRKTEADHQRVNLAFLDRLEASSSSRVSKPVAQTPESNNIWLDYKEPHSPDLSPVPSPSQLNTDSAEEEEDDCDHMWAVMKLQHNFPYYERDMLEDIVKQCNGNYQQAYDLLNV